MNQPGGGDGSRGDPPDPAKPDAAPGEPSGTSAAAPVADEARSVEPEARSSAPPVSPGDSASSVAGVAGVAGVAAASASLHASDALQYPDDGPLSAWLRRADRALGGAEQTVLFALLAAVVLTAAIAALSDRLIGIRLGRWWFDIVRGGTFSIAMIGAVFASHQQRHLSMDLVSRRLPPRGRLVLRVVLAVFTVAIAALLVRSGLHQLDTVGEESGDHLISTHTMVTFLPVGAALIIAHTLLHMVIDIDYLVRGKTPPERMRSGH